MLDLIEPRVHTQSMPLEDYLTAEEAAKKLGIKKISVLKLIYREKLRAEMHGNMYFIHRDEVARYRRERRKPGRPRTKRRYQRKEGS
jgi:excisionase family DNA binding protein